MQKNPVILVADDQQQNIELLEAILIPHGYTILTASTGQDVLGTLANQSIDLLLLDVMMPNMDGFEVTRRVRQMEEYQILPIVLVTALHKTEDRVKGIEAGCDDFISKPVDKSELLSRVRSLLKVKAYHDLKSNYQKELKFEVVKATQELIGALEKIEKASLDTIFRLSTAAEYKDKETGAHVQRMSLYSEAIARQLGLGEKRAKMIRYAAAMHDVGKIGIPDRILLKRGKLDEEEWAIMKKHTLIGAKILKDSDEELIRLGEVVALTHHEKWDGSGYPSGLSGAQIPIEGRITAIADVYDALLSKRPYKEPLPNDKVCSIIQENRGLHFDPELVDMFFAIQEEISAIRAAYLD